MTKFRSAYFWKWNKRSTWIWYLGIRFRPLAQLGGSYWTNDAMVNVDDVVVVYFFLNKTRADYKLFWLLLSNKITSRLQLFLNKYKLFYFLQKHITSVLTTVKDHVTQYSETAFSNSQCQFCLVIKNLPMSSNSCDCVTFRVLKYLLSSFAHYTPHCHMI